MSEMPFQLRIEGRAPIPLNDAFLTRRLGAPAKWHFIADLKSAGWTDADEAGFVRQLLKAPVSVKAVWEPGGFEICPSATVVGLTRNGPSGRDIEEWRGFADRLDVFAESTAPSGVGVSPFLPRRRVHKADNMLQLIDRFRHIALTDLAKLRNELAKLEFPDNKGKACIIQDGLSDWSFFAYILDQCRLMAPRATWLPLTLVGRVGNGETAGEWMVTPGVKAPYKEWGESDARKFAFDPGDGPERFEFDEISGTSSVPSFPSATYPSLGVGRPWRTFQFERWKAWRDRDLPLFMIQGSQEDMVWSIRDHIIRGPQNNIGWGTYVFSAPPETEIAGPIPVSRPCPWVGCGEVAVRQKLGPWIKVKLNGFEEGSNLVDVRLSTPFSGTDGRKGLHFVPEGATKVELCWPGRFDSSVVLLGNTRWDAADFDSPSIYLEDTHTAQLKDVDVKRIGEVTIGSGLSMAVREQTSLSSPQQFKVHAAGADLKLSGGVVYTGR